MTDLLPCPFCGGEATLEEVPEKSMGGIRWTVGCNETDEDEEGGAFAVLCYGYQSLTTFARQHEAIAAWNRRASDARRAEDQAALAAMRRMVDAARMVAAATRHELALECRRMGMEESEYRTLLSASQTLLDDAINHLAAEAAGKKDAPQT